MTVFFQPLWYDFMQGTSPNLPCGSGDVSDRISSGESENGLSVYK